MDTDTNGGTNFFKKSNSYRIIILNEEINKELKEVQQKEKGINMIRPNYENKIIDLKGKII